MNENRSHAGALATDSGCSSRLEEMLESNDAVLLAGNLIIGEKDRIPTAVAFGNSIKLPSACGRLYNVPVYRVAQEASQTGNATTYLLVSSSGPIAVPTADEGKLELELTHKGNLRGQDLRLAEANLVYKSAGPGTWRQYLSARATTVPDQAYGAFGTVKTVYFSS